MSENKSGVCPKCGGTSGFYTKGEVWQYYKSNGDPNGYEFVGKGKMATCLDCGKRIKLTALLREKKSEEKYRVGTTVYAIVKNSYFQLEVTDAVVEAVSDTAVILEKNHSSLTGSRWVFHKDDCDDNIFAEESQAKEALAKRTKCPMK